MVMSERMRFEKWAKDGFMLQRSFSDTYRSTITNAAWEVWQAALSTRKPYGYGIADKDGELELIRRGDLFKENFQGIVNCWNASEPVVRGSPYRLVELFYEDQS
jgi:hypothetical protein